MHTLASTIPLRPTDTGRYARCIASSKRMRWEIDRDVIRGRSFDPANKFLPDSLSCTTDLEFLDVRRQRRVSQIQGRTYANVFGLVEHFIGAKMLEVSSAHALGDQIALEALVRFTDEEMKHQELFRRIERLAAACMPHGYRFAVDANKLAERVLNRSTWAVLGLTCHIELFTQAHYRSSIHDADVSDLFKDVFLFHGKEESQHAVLDELEWFREDAKLSDAQRDAAVIDLVELLTSLDDILQAQAAADADYFLAVETGVDVVHRSRIAAAFLKAYRWQYILSGALDPRFQTVLSALVSPIQLRRVQDALAAFGEAASAQDFARSPLPA